MGNINNTLKYSCSDDCARSGCPTHEATLSYNSNADGYRFYNGKNDVKYFERGELEAFITLLKSIDRADAVRI